MIVVRRKRGRIVDCAHLYLLLLSLSLWLLLLLLL
jgi:hypothetical protein